ncbi:MAG: YbjN domain-containing protein [Leptolyngbyaceae cyanobacterium MAG.088]|nr:YbjN domain-containing protein [Leptolyngbyaceae cyanobacterium MAG.088]
MIPWVLGVGIFSVASITAWEGLYGQSSPQFLTNTAQLQPLQSKQGTTVQDLEKILKAEAENLKSENGQLIFNYDGREMVILTSESHNRMRLIAPIAAADTLTDEQRQDLLAANFHSALDGRYAVSNGIVFAAFLHPLSTLDESEFRSALRQVSALVTNYGTSYSSGELQFGAQQEDALKGLPAI